MKLVAQVMAATDDENGLILAIKDPIRQL